MAQPTTPGGPGIDRQKDALLDEISRRLEQEDQVQDRFLPFAGSWWKKVGDGAASLRGNDLKTRGSNSPVDRVLLTGRAREQESPKIC